MYVVMGATGNTGSVVAASLLAKGQHVRVIGRSAERLKRLIAKSAEPFVGDISDAAALTEAFTGAQAAYLMIPPDMKREDFRAYQDRITRAIGEAVEKSRVEYVVSLSSIGADKPDKTGPVVGLHRLEQRLNRIEGLKVLHLRAGYFMENTLAQIGIIKAIGMAAGPLRPDLKLPMIATRDIGVAAAEALLTLDFHQQNTAREELAKLNAAGAAGTLFTLNFHQQQIRELFGQRDLDMTEAAAIIGKVIGKRDLKYCQLPDDKIRTAMTQMGMSENVASLALEMSAALNSGHMRALEQRSTRNTTPTSFETFAAEEFLPRYRGLAAA